MHSRELSSSQSISARPPPPPPERSAKPPQIPAPAPKPAQQQQQTPALTACVAQPTHAQAAPKSHGGGHGPPLPPDWWATPSAQLLQQWPGQTSQPSQARWLQQQRPAWHSALELRVQPPQAIGYPASWASRWAPTPRLPLPPARAAPAPPLQAAGVVSVPPSNVWLPAAQLVLPPASLARQPHSHSFGRGAVPPAARRRRGRPASLPSTVPPPPPPAPQPELPVPHPVQQARALQQPPPDRKAAASAEQLSLPSPPLDLPQAPLAAWPTAAMAASAPDQSPQPSAAVQDVGGEPNGAAAEAAPAEAAYAIEMAAAEVAPEETEECPPGLPQAVFSRPEAPGAALCPPGLESVEAPTPSRGPTAAPSQLTPVQQRSSTLDLALEDDEADAAGGAESSCSPAGSTHVVEGTDARLPAPQPQRPAEPRAAAACAHAEVAASCKRPAEAATGAGDGSSEAAHGPSAAFGEPSNSAAASCLAAHLACLPRHAQWRCALHLLQLLESRPGMRLAPEALTAWASQTGMSQQDTRWTEVGCSRGCCLPEVCTFPSTLGTASHIDVRKPPNHTPLLGARRFWTAGKGWWRCRRQQCWSCAS